MNKEQRYNVQALWASLNVADEELEQAATALQMADAAATNARNRKNEAERYADSLKKALTACVEGKATVEFNEARKRFCVKFRDAAGVVELPPLPDDSPHKHPAPLNGAHVGSSIQGRTG